jgi:hypothetical protein
MVLVVDEPAKLDTGDRNPPGWKTDGKTEGLVEGMPD